MRPKEDRTSQPPPIETESEKLTASQQVAEILAQLRESQLSVSKKQYRFSDPGQGLKNFEQLIRNRIIQARKLLGTLEEIVASGEDERLKLFEELNDFEQKQFPVMLSELRKQYDLPAEVNLSEGSQESEFSHGPVKDDSGEVPEESGPEKTRKRRRHKRKRNNGEHGGNGEGGEDKAVLSPGERGEPDLEQRSPVGVRTNLGEQLRAALANSEPPKGIDSRTENNPGPEIKAGLSGLTKQDIGRLAKALKQTLKTPRSKEGQPIQGAYKGDEARPEPKSSPYEDATGALAKLRETLGRTGADTSRWVRKPRDLPPGELGGILARKDASQAAEEKQNRRENEIRGKAAYQLLANWYRSGVSLQEIVRAISGKQRSPYLPTDAKSQEYLTAFRVLEKDMPSDERNPNRLLAKEIVKKFAPEGYDAAGKSIKEQLLDVLGQAKFVYEAKVDPRTGRFGKGELGMDADAKVLLWMFRLAGFKGAFQAEPAAAGRPVAGAVNLDLGGQSGVGVMDLPKSDETGQLPTLMIDNHPRGRSYPTSSAQAGYQFLKDAGFFEKLQPEDLNAIKLMVRYSVDEDNARYPETKAGRVADFKNSYKTLYGLARYLSSSQLFEYFRNGMTGAGTDLETRYRYLLLQREMTSEELEKFSLTEKLRPHWSRDPLTAEKQKGKLTTPDFVLVAVEQAIRRYGRPMGKLLEEGRLVNTRLGAYAVEVVRDQLDKLIMGHVAARGFGFSGLVSYDARNGSFMINTLSAGRDLSRDEKLMALADKAGAVVVRGAMIIKPRSGEGAQVSLKEIFDALAPDYEIPEKGYLKEMLELEARGELKPVEKEDDKFYGDKEILGKIAQENLTKFKEWLLKAYEIDDDSLRRGLGERFHALVSGDVEKYIELIGAEKVRTGKKEVRRAIIKNNVPFLLEWLLENYQVSRAELKKAFGQAYDTLGFSQVPDKMETEKT